MLGRCIVVNVVVNIVVNKVVNVVVIRQRRLRAMTLREMRRLADKIQETTSAKATSV